MLHRIFRELVVLPSFKQMLHLMFKELKVQLPFQICVGYASRKNFLIQENISICVSSAGLGSQRKIAISKEFE